MLMMILLAIFGYLILFFFRDICNTPLLLLLTLLFISLFQGLCGKRAQYFVENQTNKSYDADEMMKRFNSIEWQIPIFDTKSHEMIEKLWQLR